jgi:hypothetical protein
LTSLKELIQSCIETLQHRLQYPLTVTHPILPKPTKPFILAYSVIAIGLHFSVPGKAYLSVCSSSIIGFSKARGKSIDRGIAERV